MSLVEEHGRPGKMSTILLHKIESSRDKSSLGKSLGESSQDKNQGTNHRGMSLAMSKKEMIADMKMTIGMMMVTRLWRTPGTGEETKGHWGPESEGECIRTMIAGIG